MPNCIVPGCRSNYTKETRARIYSFPKDENLRKKWVSAIPRQNLNLTSSSVVR